MGYRILDLETVGLAQAGEWFDPPKAPSNYKDPLKIDAYVKEATEERNSKFGLDPDTCRIVAIGFHDVNHAQPTVYLCSNEFEEREHLKMFWDSYYRASYPDFVTFNGLRFDLPVLMRRSMYLDVPYPALNLDRYRTPHLDLWQRLSFNGAISAHSLAFYARRLGIGTLDKVKGADIEQLVKEGQWDAIEAHCLSDIGLTHALANRLGLLKIGVAA